MAPSRCRHATEHRTDCRQGETEGRKVFPRHSEDFAEFTFRDEGVKHAGLENLRVVNLGGTRVTEAGKQRLQKLLSKAELLP